MKKIILAALLVFGLLGCDNDTNEVIDVSGIATPCVECPVCPEPIVADPIIVYGQIDDIWLDSIDTTNIKLNHYVNDVMIEENLADIISVDGKLISSNPITLPVYTGELTQHILVVEFWQIK